MENFSQSFIKADQETKSYMIFIFEKMVDHHILQIIPEDEMEEESDNRFSEQNPYGIMITTRELIVNLFRLTKDWSDLQTLLQVLERHENRIYDEGTVLQLLKVFEELAYDLRYKPLSAVRPLYKQFFDFFQNSLYKLRNDDDLTKYREEVYYESRETLIATIIFFYHLDFMTDSDFMDNLTWMFDNLNTKSLDIKQHPIFISLLALPAPQVKFLHKFHFLVKKFVFVVKSVN